MTPLSKREALAGMAMAAMASSEKIWMANQAIMNRGGAKIVDSFASDAVKLADALLAELERTSPSSK